MPPAQHPIQTRHQVRGIVGLDLRALCDAVREVEGFNAKLAVLITNGVGTMAAAYLFALLALISLPDAIKAGRPEIVSWVAQTFLQLVLLAVIMVGQRVQSAASDARAAQQFADTEHILDRLDEHTEGGIALVLERIDQHSEQLVALLAQRGIRGGSPS
jgi:hypothetical protein